MKIATHQPDFIPYLGLFWKIYCSDALVVLDDVQYSKRGMHDFNYIKTAQGKMKVKIPVSCEYTSKINEVKFADTLWYKKFLKTLEMNYKRAQYFNEVQSLLQNLLSMEYNHLSDLNIAVYKEFLRRFNFERQIILSSQLDIQSTKEQRILDICSKLNAETYISGTGAASYQNEEDFNGIGVQLKYAKFEPFEYKQMWGEFIPNLSVIDYVMNCGFDSLKEVFDGWKM